MYEGRWIERMVQVDRKTDQFKTLIAFGQPHIQRGYSVFQGGISGSDFLNSLRSDSS